MRVTYDSNNSGGRWWLTDENWLALERAGWVVDWVKDWPDSRYRDPDNRWLGALARSAHKIVPDGTSLREVVSEWERVTGLSSTNAGCPCCGQPHFFKATREDDGDGPWIESDPRVSHTASW